ncbi:protein FAR1-RELATED SEQUENCE 5-like [Hordeum vulgare]|nr:protein FAR1-RELATED SEQUENCE 5-like [Hordeum vulgare]
MEVTECMRLESSIAEETTGLTGISRQLGGVDEVDERLAVAQTRDGAANGEANASTGSRVSLLGELELPAGQSGASTPAEPGRAQTASRRALSPEGSGRALAALLGYTLVAILTVPTHQINCAYSPDRETVGTSHTVLPANTDQTLDASSNHTPNDDNANEDEGMPEVMSTTQQPTSMMRFDTLEDAEKHYKMYARQKGFGVRYCFRKKSEASGELIRASLVCHRAGLKIKRKVDTQNPQPIAPERRRNTTERTNCPARMFVKRRDNAWVVTEINDNHNHPLIKKWSLTGQMRLLTELHGQREAIGYTDKDLENLLAKFRAEHKYTDMQDTIEYFKSSQQLDKDFFYKYKLDDEDKIMVQLGVTTLPAAYILKRWTWLAEEMLVDMSPQVPGKVHEMPEESVILMKTTLMKNEFASLAKVGCRTGDGRKIIGTHLMEMKRELAALAKEQKKRGSRADFAAVSSATAASAPSMSKYAAQPAHSAPIHGFNNQGRSSCEVPFEPSIMGHGATAASTHTMSNTATPSVYTSPAAASSNNQGRSSNASAFDPQIQGQSALLAAMSAPVMPNPTAPGVYSAQLGASTRHGHSTYVAPVEPNILGYGATATPATTQPVSRSATLAGKQVLLGG